MFCKVYEVFPDGKRFFRFGSNLIIMETAQ